MNGDKSKASSDGDVLREKLEETQGLFWEEFAHVAATWNFGIGPFRLRRVVSSQGITRVYVMFNVLCFAVGVGLIAVGGIPGNVGIALVVGALFAFGSFVSQVWAVAAQHEREVQNRVLGDYELAELKRLAKEMADLQTALDGLQVQDSGEN